MKTLNPVDLYLHLVPSPGIPMEGSFLAQQFKERLWIRHSLPYLGQKGCPPDILLDDHTATKGFKLLEQLPRVREFQG
jgi:hypothetical protein